MMATTADNATTALAHMEDIMKLWHSYSIHDGGRPCSHYVGDFLTALIEGLRYQRCYGGRLHLERS